MEPNPNKMYSLNLHLQAISCQCCQHCQNSIKNAVKLARWAVQIANKLPDEQMLFPSLPGHPCKFAWFDFLKLLLISSAGCETFVPAIYWLLLKMKAWICYRDRINFSGGWFWFFYIKLTETSWNTNIHLCNITPVQVLLVAVARFLFLY